MATQGWRLGKMNGIRDFLIFLRFFCVEGGGGTLRPALSGQLVCIKGFEGHVDERDLVTPIEQRKSSVITHQEHSLGLPQRNPPTAATELRLLSEMTPQFAIRCGTSCFPKIKYSGPTCVPTYASCKPSDHAVTGQQMQDPRRHR